MQGAEIDVPPTDYNALLACYEISINRTRDLQKAVSTLESENTDLRDRYNKSQTLNKSLMSAQEKSEADLDALNQEMAGIKRAYEDSNKKLEQELAR